MFKVNNKDTRTTPNANDAGWEPTQSRRVAQRITKMN